MLGDYSILIHTPVSPYYTETPRFCLIPDSEYGMLLNYMLLDTGLCVIKITKILGETGQAVRGLDPAVGLNIDMSTKPKIHFLKTKADMSRTLPMKSFAQYACLARVIRSISTAIHGTEAWATVDHGVRTPG